MRRIITHFLVSGFILLFAASAHAQTYCTPTYTYACTSGDFIQSFSTTGGQTNITNLNTGCSGTGNYNFYSTMTHTGIQGDVVNFAVVNCPNWQQGYKIWVDWNNNGILNDPGEEMYASATTIAAAASFTGNFTIPNTAPPGMKRMRIRCVYFDTVFDPCTEESFGDAEDYNLMVLARSPSTSGGGTFCAGSSTSLVAFSSSMPNATFYWIDKNGTFINSSTITLNNLDSSHTGFYTAYAIYSPGPGLPLDTSLGAVTAVHVNKIPPTPIVDSSITYCMGEPFTNVPIFGQNLKWYTVPSGGIPSFFAPQINTSVAGTATYYVSQTVNNCESKRATVTISVAPKPDPPVVTTPVGYCQGNEAEPLSALGQNILWYSVPTGGVGTPVTPTPSTNAQGTFTWYVSQTVEGCESIRVPVEVNVSYRPNALITSSRPYVCQYDTLTLTYFGNALPNAEYLWTLPIGTSTESGTGQGPLVVRFDSAGLLTMKLVVDNNGCISDEATLQIPVTLSPRFALDLPTDACREEVVNIAVNYATTGIDSYNWNGFAGGEMAYGSLTAGPYGIKWNTPGVKVLEIIATDDICNSLPVYDTITIHDLPDASIQVNTSNICAGDTVEFRANYNPEYSYNWEPYQFFGTSHSHVDTGIVDFPTYVKLNVTSEFNCRATDSILINAQPCCDIYFPNAFTPNNDGRNDLFRPVTIGSHQISVFRVQNRWGQTVYESRNERAGWDGTYGSKPQDMGTYFYYVKYKCSDGNFYEDKGELMLVR